MRTVRPARHGAGQNHAHVGEARHALKCQTEPGFNMLQVYGETSVGKESGCNEMSTLEPTNPYSAAKAGAGQQAPLCT